MFIIKVIYHEPDSEGKSWEELHNMSRPHAISAGHSISALARVRRVEVTGPHHVKVANYEGGEAVL